MERGGGTNTILGREVIKGVMDGPGEPGEGLLLAFRTRCGTEIWSPKSKVTEKNVFLAFPVPFAYHCKSALCCQELLRCTSHLVNTTKQEQRTGAKGKTK